MKQIIIISSISFVCGMIGALIYLNFYPPTYPDLSGELLEAQELNDSLDRIIHEQRNLIEEMAEDCGR